MSRLTSRDLERLAALNLKTIIDLRFDDERARAPDRVPTTSPPDFFHRGLLPKGSIELMDAINNRGAGAELAFELMCKNYSRIPFEHTSQFRDVMHHIISDDRAPHFIHCTSGKDRTGLIIACILAAAGVNRETIMDDYEMSNCEHQAVDVFESQAHEDAVAIIMAARPEYLAAALDAIDAQCGTFENYLRDYLDFGASEIQALRALLLDA